MQALQPTQRRPSKSTMPSLRRNSAVVGQISTQGASAQWLQRVTWKLRRVSGKTPFSTYLTQVRATPSATWCSALQATEQAWQPMQRRLSIRKAYCKPRDSSRRLLDDDQLPPELGVVRLQATVERELAGALGRQLDDGGLAGRDALLHAQRVEGEAVLLVGRLQQQLQRLALAQLQELRLPPRAGRDELELVLVGRGRRERDQQQRAGPPAQGRPSGGRRGDHGRGRGRACRRDARRGGDRRGAAARPAAAARRRPGPRRRPRRRRPPAPRRSAPCARGGSCPTDRC